MQTTARAESTCSLARNRMSIGSGQYGQYGHLAYRTEKRDALSIRDGLSNKVNRRVRSKRRSVEASLI